MLTEKFFICASMSLLALICLASEHAHSATYYLDPDYNGSIQNGSGSSQAIYMDGGNIYYVDDDGIDSSSCFSSPSISNPCKTINYVISNVALKGGDTVYIRAGTYTESLQLTTADDGDDANGYVVFKTYGNEDVTIITTESSRPLYIYEAGATVKYIKFDGLGNDSGKHLSFKTTASTDCIILRRAEYIHLTGFKAHGAQGPSGRGIYMLSQNYGSDNNGTRDDNGPKNCIIEYGDFYNNGGHGIKVTGWATNNNIIRYCNSYQNGTSGNGDDQGMNMSGSGYQDSPPTGNVVHNCTFYNNYGNGASILDSPNTKFYNNKIYSNGDNNVDGIYENSAARGFVVSGISDNCTVYNNTVYDNAYYNLQVTGDSNLIYNNLLYRTTGNRTLVVFDGGATNNKFYNNSIYGNGGSGYSAALYIKGSDGVTGTVIKNNMIWGVSCYAMRNSGSPGGLIENNNLYVSSYGYLAGWNGHNYSTISAFNDGETEAGDNISEHPQWDGYFRLTASTFSGINNTRDGGQDLSSEHFSTDINGVSRPQGAAWDIGAYEYVPVSSTDDPKGDGTLQQIKEYALLQNYPNPFSAGGGSAYGGNPGTRIKYQIGNSITHENSSSAFQSVNQVTDGPVSVELKIYDLLGKEIATLVNEQQRPDIYEVTWDASNLPSGVYFYQLRAGNFIQVKKLILMK